MEDLTDEEEVPASQSTENRVLPAPAPRREKTNEELQEELRNLQEQMKALQEQLKVTTIKQTASPARLQK
ncbi:minichromosome maintenance 10 replication initiation factor, partial [Homo sapiens]